MAESAKQQQQRIKLEQEYQAALKVSASLNAKIADEFKKSTAAAGELGDEVSKFTDGLKSTISNLSNSESVQKELLKLEAKQRTLLASINDENKELVGHKLDALEFAIEELNNEHKKLVLIEAVNQKALKYKENIEGALTSMTSHIRQVPVLGNMLGKIADKAHASISGKLNKAVKEFVVEWRGGMEDGEKSTKGLGNALMKKSGGILKSIFSWKTAMLGFVSLLALSFLTLDKVEKTAISFKQQTGILNGQFAGLNSKIASASGIALGMGGSLEDGAKAAADMFNAFGGIENLSRATLDSTTRMAVGLGLSADNIGNVNKLFQNAFGASELVAQNLVQSTVNASKLAGVPADKVLKDMAESSEEVYKYFRGTPQSLQKAYVQAAKLGTSIKQAAQVAGSLLDFESSINNELEASALLGANINFNQARYLAANGDVLGSQQAVLDEVSKIGDLSKLNVYQQEALAKAAGMPIGDLINQQRIRERFGKLDADQMKAAQDLIDSGKDLSKLSKTDLEQRLKQNQAQDEMHSSMDRFKGTLSTIGMKLGSLLQPLASSILAFLNGGGMEIIKKGIESIKVKAEQLGNWFRENKPTIQEFLKGMGEGFGVVKDAVMKAWEFIKPALTWLGDKLAGLSGEESGSAGGLGKKIVVLGAAFMGLKFILPLIRGIGGGIFGVGKSLLGLGKTATSTASSSGGFLKTLGDGIKSIGQGLGGAIKSIASGLGSAMKSIGSGIGGLISSISRGIGTALGAIGRGMGAFLKGMSSGLAALANPAALIGLGALVLAFIGLAAAMRIMAPALEPLGKMFKSIFEGIATIVVPIIDILVNGFVKLAEVIGNTMIGMMQAFAPIVETVANAFVQIATVVGETIVGIFDSVGATLGMIIQQSDKAPQVLAMAAAIGAVAVAMAALGGGAAISAISGFVGGVFDKATELIGGKTPMEKLDELLTKGPSLASFAQQVLPVMDVFNALIASIDPILSLSAAIDKFADSLEYLAKKSGKLKVAKLGEISGMAGKVTALGVVKGKTLPEGIDALAAAVSKLASSDQKSVVEKLEEIKKAVLLGALIEMDGEILSRGIGKKLEAQNRINYAGRLIS